VNVVLPKRRGATLPNAVAYGLLASVLPTSATAADSVEVWPEVAHFRSLGPGTRAYFDASYARGRDSDESSLDLSAAVDVSLKPVLRPDLLSTDWERARYVWTRIGFTHLSKSEDGERERKESRGVASLYGKLPLESGVWLEGRVRADLRWIGGDYSTRYRARVDATRDFTWRGRTITPSVNAEAFYDTRYHAWSRMLYQLGTELEVNSRFRFEVYVARQQERVPNADTVHALGMAAKWYSSRR
jgi:hypothetical protein